MRKLYAVAAVLAFALAGGGAYAAIPDSSGIIHACYGGDAMKNGVAYGTGVLRVIDTEQGQTCNQNETALSWNQQGQQGPAGPQGPAGNTGPAGPQGPAGTTLVPLDLGSITLPPDNQTSHSLATATWTQAAGTVDTVYAAVKITTPSTCTSPSGYVFTAAGVGFTLYVDGVAVSTGSAGGPLGTTITASLGGPSDGTYALDSVSHTVTATARMASNCSAAGQDLVVDDLKVAVVAAS